MTKDELTRSLTQLKEEAHHLFNEELADAPGQAERVKRSRQLNDQLLGLQKQLELLVPQDRKSLLRLCDEAERDLIFLTESASDSSTTVSVIDQVQQINHEAFELAKKAGLKPVGFADQAKTLQGKLTQLLQQPGAGEAEVQRLASDASLELDYIAMGGNVPTSTRHAAYLRSAAN